VLSYYIARSIQIFMINIGVNKKGELLRPVTVALSGLGGFGECYLRALLEQGGAPVRLVAGADPNPERCLQLDQMNAAGIPIYPDLSTLLEYHQPSLLVIAAPAHLHQQQSSESLSRGIHVLCEKPAATTLADAMVMCRTQSEADKVLAIGYQWSFSRAVQNLKGDIIAGHLGRPKRLRSLVLWPRNGAYYHRNAWAGRIFAANGEPVHDNPVSNGCAHFLHNMLYVLGETPSQSAWPAAVECETYRANNEIENFDTAVLRVGTESGAEVLLVASHATAARREPMFRFEFDDAVVTYDLGAEARVVARWNSGKIRDYGSLPSSGSVQKLWTTLQVIQHGGEVPCGMAAATPHVAVVSATQQCAINPISPSMVRADGFDGQREGPSCALSRDLTRCYDLWALPSELKFSWSSPQERVSIPRSALSEATCTRRQPMPKEHAI
jgi:predicted dehydrogenase